MAAEFSLPNTHNMCKGLLPVNGQGNIDYQPKDTHFKRRTLIVDGFGVDLRFCQEDTHHLKVALLDGKVEGVVAALVNCAEVSPVLQQDGSYRR